MPVLNGIRNEVTRPNKANIVINGGKSARINGINPHEYNKWRMIWNGNHFAPPDANSVLYLPGVPGFGSTIHDFSDNFSDSGIDTDEELDATETGITCDADATTAIPVGSIIIIESERCFVTATGATLTVNRGYGGTVAATHTTNQDIRVWLPNNGTIVGAVWTRLPSGLWALSFDFLDDVVTIADSASLRLVQPYTIKFWVYRATTFSAANTVRENILGKFQTANKGFLLYFWEGAGCGNIRLLVGDGTGYYTDTSLKNSWAIGWWHVVMTVSNVDHFARFYVKGALDKTGTTVFPAISQEASSFYLGAISSISFKPINGYLALVELFNGKLWTLADAANSYAQERWMFGI